MSEHTPGDWVVNRGDHAHISNVLFYGLIAYLGECEDKSGPLFVCVDDGRIVGQGGDAEMVANARLIAAAPDLLEALRSVEWSGEQHDRDNCWNACPSCGAMAAGCTYDMGGKGDPGQHLAGCTLTKAIAKAAGR